MWQKSLKKQQRVTREGIKTTTTKALKQQQQSMK